MNTCVDNWRSNLPNQTNWPCQYEESIQISNLNYLINLLFAEHSTARKKIQEEGSNCTVDIQNQVIGLWESVCFNLNSILHVLHRREMSVSILLQKLHSLVPVVSTLDPTSIKQNELTIGTGFKESVRFLWTGQKVFSRKYFQVSLGWSTHKHQYSSCTTHKPTQVQHDQSIRWYLSVCQTYWCT